MKPLTEELVSAIAHEMVPSLSGDEPCQITVNRERRLIKIWWDSLVEREDHRFALRCTAVDLTDTEEMVRYRIRAMFANDAHLQYVGRYGFPQSITVVDHPDEPPPYEVQPL